MALQRGHFAEEAGAPLRSSVIELCVFPFMHVPFESLPADATEMRSDAPDANDEMAAARRSRGRRGLTKRKERKIETSEKAEPAAGGSEPDASPDYPIYGTPGVPGPIDGPFVGISPPFYRLGIMKDDGW